MACAHGHLEVVRVLIRGGAAVDKAKYNGATPLFVACQDDFLPVARLLVDSGADMNKARDDGCTPLFMACQEPLLPVVRMLIEGGADKDKPENGGTTPLFMVCDKGHLEAARLLLESGATDASCFQYGDFSEDIKLLLALPWDEWNAATPARQEAVRRHGWEYLSVPHRWNVDNHGQFPSGFQKQVSAAIMVWQAGPDVAVVLAEELHARWGLR